jgi:hypothetical protein
MRRKNAIIIGTALSAVIVAAAVIHLTQGRFFGRRFPLEGDIIREVTSVFENAESLEDVESFCIQNRRSCGYYCNRINPAHAMCEQLNLTGAYDGFNFTRRGVSR